MFRNRVRELDHLSSSRNSESLQYTTVVEHSRETLSASSQITIFYEITS